MPKKPLKNQGPPAPPVPGAQQLIVLGMHRSGTSALTGALHAMGAFVGDEAALTGKNPENPLSFFERRDARHICDAILHKSGADWWKVANFDVDRVPHTLIRARLPEIETMVSQLEAGAGPEGAWVLKEPRLCLLYPIFRRVLLKPHIIIPVRHPAEVAKSLRRRNGFTLQAGLALWEAYMVSVARVASGQAPILVNYDDLIASTGPTLQKLSDDLQARGVHGLDPEAGAAAILTTLRREDASDRDEQRLSPAQAELWASLIAGTLPDKSITVSTDARDCLLDFEADEGSRKDLEAEIRSLRSQLKDATERSDRLSAALAETEALSAELKTEAAGREALAATIEEKTEDIALLTGLIETLTSDLEAETERAENLAKKADQLDEAQKQVAQLTQSLDEVTAKAEAETARADNAGVVSKQGLVLIDELQRRVDALRLKRDGAVSALAETQSESKGLSDALETANQSVSHLKRKLEDAQKTAKAQKQDAHRFRDEFQKAENRAKHAETHSQELSRKTESLAHELEVANGRLTAALATRDQLKRTLRWKAGAVLLAPLAPFRYLQLQLRQRRNRVNRRVIEASGLFDRDRYIELNPDLQDTGFDPVDHYLTTGWREDRDIGGVFSARAYLESYLDVAALNTNPLLHYINHGRAEGRSPNPSPASDCPERDSRYEHVQASGLFNETFYLSAYPDVRTSGIDGLDHYLNNGWKEGRDPSPAFSTDGYLAKYPDVAAASINPLIHYLENGQSEGRSPVSRAEFASTPDTSARGAHVQPDLFSIRAARRTSRKVVIIKVQDLRALEELTQQAQKQSWHADIIAVHANTFEAPEPIKHLHERSTLFAIGYPEKDLFARTVFHLINQGPLSDYKQVIRVSKADQEFVSSQTFAEELSEVVSDSFDARALTADMFRSYDIDDDLPLRQALGIFFARVGRERHRGQLTIPLGRIISIPALVCQQIKAYRIGLKEVPEGPAGEHLLLALIGAIADEADLKTTLLEDNSEPSKLAAGNGRQVKTIAFYLPQFHAIEENDRWWGKGFTEWTNVAKARPLFRGHHQPQLPADLGFYDLRSPATQLAQANLAHDYGLHGFCYYYYWFDGKKVLNEPIEQLLKSGSPDFPFCVCWANENWSRNWDGQNKHVLLKQSYSEDSNRALIHEFIKLMRDERYIRHNGKPVLLVYRIRIIPNWLETAKMWRDECRKAGIGEIHLCAVRFGLEPLDGHPSEYGLDSFVIFPPHESEKIDVRDQVRDLAKDFNGTILDYDSAMSGDLDRFEDGYPWPVHRGVMLGWDNTARRPRDSRIFLGSTPARLHRWLKGILSQEDRHNRSSESLIFVNAWNEWAEGTMLEPSARFGRGYLEAVHAVVGPKAVQSKRPSPKPAVAALEAPRPADEIDTEWLNGSVKRKAALPTVLVCAHVVSHQLFGGERSFLDMLDALGKLDVNVIVALPTRVHTYYTELCLERSCGVAILPYEQWRDNREADSGVVEAFASLILNQRIDLVYANTIVLLEPLVAARQTGRVTMVHARELVDRDEGLRQQINLDSQKVVEAVTSRTDAIVANSQATQRLFDSYPNTFCVPNIIDPDALDIDNPVGDKVRFAMASSNIPKKGLDDFAEIARRCRTLAPDAEFVLVGPKNVHTEALMADAEASNIVFSGYADTPASAMQKGNVILSLSEFAESFGRTVAEAQAARRPVIAYDWGAVPELISHGETGFLAPYRDIDIVCQYIQTICHNRDLIAELGQAGRAKMLQGYTPEVLTEGLRNALETTLARPIRQSDAGGAITIVVPIFNAHKAVEACLNSLETHVDRDDNVRILLLNDASTDPAIAPLLEQYAERDGFELHTNPVNKGYTKTINIGIKWAGADDIVLLNSDAVVTEGWLNGLRRAAYSQDDVATATAMSDNAGAFSFPVQNAHNPKPEDVSYDAFASSILAKTGQLDPVNMPTGSGFCMFVRRDALDTLGLFDEEAFPRGYGEENDFCMRAIKAGLRNVISPYSYVFHVRSASFGEEKETLIKGAVDTVTARYPEYAALVKASFSSAEMQALRKASRDGIMAL